MMLIAIDRHRQRYDLQCTVGPLFAGQVRLSDDLRFLELLLPGAATAWTTQVWPPLVRHTSCRRICEC